MHTMNAATRIATPAGMAVLGLEAAERWVDLEDSRSSRWSVAKDQIGWVATAMLRRAAIGGGP